MRVLLLGKNGQLGWELQRSLSLLGELIALDRSSLDYCGDLSNLAGIKQTLQQLKPNIIVNAAAYTAVDKAESDPELAYLINAQAPKLLAEEAQAQGAWLVHYSSDYVFDGAGDLSRSEQDPTAPLNSYGQSKLLGEQYIQASGCLHLIFRTSWVYAVRGNNFAKTMLRLAQERNALSVIEDQVGAPTSAELLADLTALCLRTALDNHKVSGVYHAVAAGETSWFEYAQYVLCVADVHGIDLKVFADQIQPILTSEYQTPAQRPLNSRLSTEKLQQTFSVSMPTWQVGVHRMLTELLAG